MSLTFWIKKRRKPQIQTKTIKKSKTDIDKDVQNIPPISKEYCLDAKIASKNTMLTIVYNNINKLGSNNIKSVPISVII